MFCYQCEETINNKGCTTAGACGKKGEVANLQDLLIYLMKGISICNIEARKQGKNTEKANKFIMNNLFATITNANFDKKYFLDKIQEAIKLREKIKDIVSIDSQHDSVNWQSDNEEEILKKSEKIGILSTENEDIRSLRWLLTYGLKGIAAYSHHAYVLDVKDEEIFKFIQEGLVGTTKELSVDELVTLVLKCGEMGVKTMAMLDKANTSKYGNPEITKVNIGVRNNPGILISGHDLKDLEWLLKYTFNLN